MPLPPTPASSPLSANSLLRDLVRQIHEDPFVRKLPKRGNGLVAVQGAPTVTGWDKRVSQYAYAKSGVVSFKHVYHLLGPIIADLRAIVGGVANWAAISTPAALGAGTAERLEFHAQTIHMWGGVSKKWGYAKAWEVVKAAVTGVAGPRGTMDSGWTKVASLATDSHPNSQTIWDSRVSTSIISRLDSLGALPSNPTWSRLSVVPPSGLNGTRPRKLTQAWPSAGCTWAAHFGGSVVVRAIVDILNDPTEKYPRMPQPHGPSKDWDVFGVGLVLFMDGY